MKKSIFIAGGLVLMFLAEQIQAQNFIRDYVLDKHADYQPDDHVERGLIYRLQTGHAGAFKNCDDDLNKMYSPYINWNCRPGSPPRPAWNFVSDFDRKLTRFRDGAGTCAIHSSGNCDPGLIGYETADSPSQVAADRLAPNDVSQPGRQFSAQPADSFKLRGPHASQQTVNEASAERFEQLRIQRLHR